MPNYRDFIRDREMESERLQNKLDKMIKEIELSLLTDLSFVILGLKKTGNNIDPSRNSIPATQSKIKRIYAKYKKHVKTFIVPFIVSGVYSMLDLNSKYFQSVKQFNANSLSVKSNNKYFQLLGYDQKNKKIRNGSWLSGLSASESSKISTMQRISSAILSGIPVQEFNKQFRHEFSTKIGVSKHWKTHTNTMFMGIDRSAQKFYADELNLNLYLYSGTVKSNTRPFCAKRANRIYTKGEIESWAQKEWKGKINGADVFVVLGGYNCRHHLSAISEEIANTISRYPINSYS